MATGVACALAGCTGAVDDDDETPDEVMVVIEGPEVLPHVQRFANQVCTETDACAISTYVGHSPSAERAIDILVSDRYGTVPSDDNALGNRVAELALARRMPAGIEYVIWRQRIHLGEAWKAMEDRGSITKNHYDHVHVSFEETAP